MLRDPRGLEAIDESAESIQRPRVETVRAPERQSDAVHAQRVMRADELERAHRRAATHVVLGVHFQPGDGRTLGENLRDVRRTQADAGASRELTCAAVARFHAVSPTPSAPGCCPRPSRTRPSARRSRHPSGCRASRCPRRTTSSSGNRSCRPSRSRSTSRSRTSEPRRGPRTTRAAARGRRRQRTRAAAFCSSRSPFRGSVARRRLWRRLPVGHGRRRIGACRADVHRPAAACVQRVEVLSMPKRIVIVGGGFGGAAVASRLERLFRRDPDVEIVLFDRENFSVFTPLLPEVPSGALEPKHVVSPLRARLRRTSVRQAEVRAIDVARRLVVAGHCPMCAEYVVEYDYLVLARGSVTNFFGLPGVAERARAMKSLADGADLHDAVIGRFEHADLDPDPRARRRLLTFVVARGGFAGVETAAELNDFVRAAGRYYPGIARDDVRVVLVHSGDRILPEVSPSLSAYALAKLTSRG